MADDIDAQLRATRKAVTNEDGTISPANHNWHKDLVPAGNAMQLVLVHSLERAIKEGNIKPEDLT